MEVAHPELWLSVLVVGSIVGSISVWVLLLRRLRIYGSFLPGDSRQPVPWNFIAALPAFLFAIMTVSGAFARHGQPRELTLHEFVIGMSQMFLFAIVVIGLVVVASRPTWRDLGLPINGKQLLSDFLLGSTGCLACLLPVFGVQILLSYLLQDSSQNPVIKLVEENPDPQRLVFAFVSAVIFAPITEELYFRLLLQGWLEKITPRLDSAPEPLSNAHEFGIEEGTDVETHFKSAESSTSCERESTRSWWQGIVPIAISSLLFALAHVGNGPDPWAIFVFALFQGYLYHRTHRILPCIVLHMLFNGLSLLYLWLFLQLPPIQGMQ